MVLADLSELSGVPVREERRHVLRALGALLIVVAVGTAGFVAIEGWTPWRALYFTLITITTVGYGDEGIGEGGKLFAAVLLVVGIAIASYALAMAMRTTIANQLAWKKRMLKHVGRLKGHTVLLGFSRMGRAVARGLAREGAAFVVVTGDDDQMRDACEQGYLVVEGSPASDETLLRAGVQCASHVVCVLANEPEAIVATLSARELAPNVILLARAETEEGERKLLLAGADRIIATYRAGGREILDAVLRPHVADFLAHVKVGGRDVALHEVEVVEGSPLVGKTLEVYGRSEGSRLVFVALRRPGKGLYMPPKGGLRLLAGDVLIVAGDAEQVARMHLRGGVRPRAA
ncbi:MAG TPA: potassium channel protein [Planctomycetes bacterium]|nr:potassium channel protein [Planctomycetota bacterium]